LHIFETTENQWAGSL